MDLEKLQAAIRRNEQQIVLPARPITEKPIPMRTWIVTALMLRHDPVTIDETTARELRDRMDKLRAELLAEFAKRVN
jgi:hypothetical protein